MPELRQPLGLKALWGKMTTLLSNSTGTEVRQLAENDGTAREQLVLWETGGGTQVRWRGETTTGEAHVILNGKDSGGNVDPLRTNVDQQLQVEVVDGSYTQVDSITLSSTANTSMWSPGTGASTLYQVHLLLVNTHTADVGSVLIGHDVGDAGTLSAAEYWVYNMIVPVGGSSGWLGPFILPGNDGIRGSAATGSVVAVHFNVKQVK